MRHKHALLFAACAALAGAQSAEWATIAPRDAGLDPARLEQWRSTLAAHGTTGLIVIRRGKIALEWYASGWDADRPHGTIERVFTVLSDLWPNRCEELNNYSDWNTRSKCSVRPRSWPAGLLYAEAGTAAGAACSRRHQGPARRRIMAPTIRVAPNPVGSPQKVKQNSSASEQASAGSS